jgi:hypothetical protein
MSHTDYLMCSPEECQDRQRHKDVSVFECVDPHVPVNQRVLDPGLAVTKYRRSAAGSEKKYPIRSLEQLQTTVTYLLQLLVSRRTIYCDSRQSFLATVNFVEDRVVRQFENLTRAKHKMYSSSPSLLMYQASYSSGSRPISSWMPKDTTPVGLLSHSHLLRSGRLS